jgi:hypothetical protein
LPQFCRPVVTDLAGSSGEGLSATEIVGLLKTRVKARLALEYGVTDIDGKAPRPLTLADV